MQASKKARNRYPGSTEAAELAESTATQQLTDRQAPANSDSHKITSTESQDHKQPLDEQQADSESSNTSLRKRLRSGSLNEDKKTDSETQSQASREKAATAEDKSRRRDNNAHVGDQVRESKQPTTKARTSRRLRQTASVCLVP